MNLRSGRFLLLSLLAAWLYLCWPHWAEQLTTTRQAWSALKDLPWEDRSAAEWEAGYRAAHDLAAVVPPGGCVLVMSHTGPQIMRYYQARFAYYLYPRGARFSDHTDAPDEGCGYLAVFRDTPQNLAQDPFQGRWDEAHLARRTAGLKKIFAGAQVEIFGP